jgi:hypothetical protein
MDIVCIAHSGGLISPSLCGNEHCPESRSIGERNRTGSLVALADRVKFGPQAGPVVINVSLGNASGVPGVEVEVSNQW